MSQTVKIIKRVCDELDIKSEYLDQEKLFLKVLFPKKTKIFIANNIGLNDEVVRKICNDKFYSYILLKDLIAQPKTLNFLDPYADDIYQEYRTYQDYQAILSEISIQHEFPIIVKANNLSRGLNVHKCDDLNQLKSSVGEIFNKNSKNYSHVLVSQDFINIKDEYRVVVYKQQIMFAYKKDNAGSDFVGNLSPLHWENSKTVLIEDRALQERFEKFIEPIYQVLDLQYAGFDIAINQENQVFLIEINSQPGFTYFIRDNTDEQVYKMYKKIIEDLL